MSEIDSLPTFNLTLIKEGSHPSSSTTHSAVQNGFQFEPHGKYKVEEKRETPSASPNQRQRGTPNSARSTSSRESPKANQGSPSKQGSQPPSEALVKAQYMKQNASKLAGGDIDKMSKLYFSCGNKHGWVKEAAESYTEAVDYLSDMLDDFREADADCTSFNYEVPEERKLLAALMLKYKSELFLARLFFLYNRGVGISHYFAALMCVVPYHYLSQVLTPGEVGLLARDVIEKITPVAEFMDNQGKQTGTGFLSHFTTVLMEVVGCLTSLPSHGNYDVPDNYQRIAIFLCELGVIIKKKQAELDECTKLLGYIAECYYRTQEKWWGVDKIVEIVEILETREPPLVQEIEAKIVSCVTQLVSLEDTNRLQVLLRHMRKLPRSRKLQVLEEIVEASINMDVTCLTQIQNKYITFLATEATLARTLSLAIDNLSYPNFD